jgi:hypothetical protein
MGAHSSRSASPPPPLPPQSTSAVLPPPPSPPSTTSNHRFCNTHVTLSKAIYKPGETVYGRAILIDAVTHAPALVRPHDTDGATLKLQVKGPKGDVVHDESLRWPAPRLNDGPQPHVCSIGFQYVLADSAAGGDYEFAAHFVHWNGAAAAPRGVRRVEVRAYRPSRLKTDLDFMKQAYGPGDKVIASLRVTRAEGGAPAGATVTAVAVLDGTELHRSSIVVDRTGFCEVRFTLPADIPGPGEGSLSMAITDGGVQESAVKTIPIPRSSGLTLHFYPEGGDLAPRATQRVYVEARTAKGRPADVAGSVIETATGRVVAAFRTTHEGRGRFELDNDDSCLYHAQLHEPSGIVEKYRVGSRFSGACALRVLSTSDDVVARDMPLRLEVGPGAAAWLAVAIKGQELVRRAVDQSASNTSVSVSLTDAVAGNAYGILRVTLYDASTGSPLCERLVFRHAPSFINVAVSGPKHCGLRDKVAFTITTTDAAGVPVDASVCVVAVDDAAMKKLKNATGRRV